MMIGELALRRDDVNDVRSVDTIGISWNPDCSVSASCTERTGSASSCVVVICVDVPLDVRSPIRLSCEATTCTSWICCVAVAS